jgi:hypothetical protein
MKFEHTLTSNWENAFRGLRHPMESYKRSDSQFAFCEALEDGDVVIREDNNFFEIVNLGPNDIDLAQRMIAAKTPNDKFLRQIFVSVDITAPLYWWKEADTYKVATVANSTSTMHKLASTPITIDCFETDDIDESLILYPNNGTDPDWTIKEMYQDHITHLETLRQKYLETKDVRYWKELIRWLPEGWNQTRTWTANYSTLRGIYFWRKNHKLTEWHQFCDWIKTLPYANELLLFDN